MSDDWLFGYGGDSIDNPTSAVLVPEGMSTEEFLSKIEDSSLRDFGEAVQEGTKAASEGNLRYVDKNIETICRFNTDYALKVGALRGIPEFIMHLMGLAIENHLKHNPLTDYVRECANKYDVHLE